MGFWKSTQYNAALYAGEVHVYQDTWFTTGKVYFRLHFNHVAHLFSAAEPNDTFLHQAAAEEAPMFST